jgi:hypothetical protein
MMKEDAAAVVLAMPRDMGSGIGCLDVPLVCRQEEVNSRDARC